MNVLITGANRGLGFGFVQHYLEQGCHVWGCYRSGPGELAGLDNPHLHLIRWDVGGEAGPDGRLPESIDLLINNAGIYGPGKDGQSLEKVTPEAMLEVFNIDCVGPLRVVQLLKDRVVAAKGRVANVSSKMGSSGDNSSGGTYAYRAAKAGLVIVSKSMAMDLAPLGVRVVTDMTGHTGLIDVATSVEGMTQVIERMDEYEPGAFIAYDGKVVPY